MRRALVTAASVVVAIGAGFVWGRYTAKPGVRVETRTVTEYKDREVVRTVEGPVRWREKRVTVPGPQGPTVTVEKWIEKDPVVTDRVVTREGETRTVTLKVPARDEWRIALSGGVAGDEAWTLALDRRVLGPVWVGAYARTDALALRMPTEAGLTLGVTW